MPEPTPNDKAARKSSPPKAADDATQKRTGPGAPETLDERKPGVWGPEGPPPLPAVGARVGGFVIRRVLGEGACGRVYLAFDEKLEREVAIKMPKPEGLTPDLRERFLREARATAKIHHPNVCAVYEVVDTARQLPYLVMHYLPGTTLAAHLDTCKVLSPLHAVALMQKLALGMAAAHAQGVIHRDLKPHNVLFDPARQLVLITDFGLARIGPPAQATAGGTVLGTVLGTPLYMSPEQARGEGDKVGPRSDVYSLGIILYRMLTGRVPFDGSVLEVLFQHCEKPPVPPSVARRDLNLDSSLDALCLKALAKNPADRYPSAKAFADALREYTQAEVPTAGRGAATAPNRPAPPKPPVPPEPLAAVGRPARQKVLIGGALVLIAGAVVALFLALGNRPQLPTDPVPAPAVPPEPSAKELAPKANDPQPKPKEPIELKEPTDPELKRDWDDYTRAFNTVVGSRPLIKERGPKRAAAWKRAAEEGNESAMILYARCLTSKVDGVEENDSKAREWYEKAAVRGNRYGQNNLAALYHTGRGGPPDVLKAKAWYEKAATQDLPLAQYGLGELYEGGELGGKDRSPDFPRAQEWYEKAAAQGLAVAQNSLGRLYDEGHIGSAPNYAKAKEWYEKAATQGLAEAQNNLGKLFDEGHIGLGPNYAKAKEWYEQAAAQGNELAQGRLGVLYLEGRVGDGPNYAKAKEWFEKASAQGLAEAQNNLGVLYLEGRVEGVPDYAKAREWFEKAAAQSLAEAQNNLGQIYEQGLGVTKAPNRALDWYRKAAAQGLEAAKTAVKRLEKIK